MSAVCFAACSTWNVCVSLFLFGVGGACWGIVFHVEQSFSGVILACVRAHAYYGVVFRLSNVGGVVRLGGLHERLLLCELTSTGACAKDYWSRW